MSVMLPPYLGTWQELLKALLLDPFLGSAGGGYHPKVAAELVNPGPWGRSDHPPWNKMFFDKRPDPGPDPWGPPYVPRIIDFGPGGAWPWTAPVSFLISAVSLKQAAAGLSDEAAKAGFGSSIDEAISKFLDDYCWPPFRPWPGPPPWIYSLSAGLATAANSFQDGNLKSTLLALSSDVLSRAAPSASAASS